MNGRWVALVARFSSVPQGLLRDPSPARPNRYRPIAVAQNTVSQMQRGVVGRPFAAPTQSGCELEGRELVVRCGGLAAGG